MILNITWSAEIREDGTIFVKGLAPDTEIRIYDETATQYATVRADITLGNSSKPVADCYGFRDLRYPITAVSRICSKLNELGYDVDFNREICRIHDAINKTSEEVLNNATRETEGA